MDTIFGLPAHPLLVHVPVVMIPLAALGAVAIVISGKLRARLRWVVAGFALVGSFGALLAANAGEELIGRVPRTANMLKHAAFGETARNFSLLFTLVVVGFVGLEWLLEKRPESVPARDFVAKWGMRAAKVAAVATAMIATWTIVDAGHSGAKSTWNRAGNGGNVVNTVPGHGYDDGD